MPSPLETPTRGSAIIKSRLCRKAAKVGGGLWPLLVCAYITRCRPLALPLGELSPRVTERAGMVMVCPLRPRCARPPLPKGEARDAHTVHQNVCRGGALPRPFSQSLRRPQGDTSLCTREALTSLRGVSLPPSKPLVLTPPSQREARRGTRIATTSLRTGLAMTPLRGVAHAR